MGKTNYDLRYINRILDKADNFQELSWAGNRLAWLKKFRKAPNEILDALIAKYIAILDGNWFGDEPEQQIIAEYFRKNIA